MSKNIVINKRYFNNIEIAVKALNDFFASNYKTKNFPNIDEDSELDEGTRHCLLSISSIDSRWIDDPDVADEAVEKINSVRDDYVNYVTSNEGGNFFDFCHNSNNQTIVDLGSEYLSFKALQFATDHQEEFERLLNGLYSFELFLKPSAYKNEISLFSQNVPVGECEDVMDGTSYNVFDPYAYIQGIFENDDIQLPDDMEMGKELERFTNYQDLIDVEVSVNEAVQEAAEVNYFSDTKPKHIKYDGKKWVISQQFEKTINDLVADLRKCDTTDDLKEFFMKSNKSYAELMGQTVAPFILVNTLMNAKKANRDFDNATFGKYTDSYKSIINKNKGAKRFENYDIFTTFKADKEGTLKFIQDFCTLKLINDNGANISNNTLLTLFNIFDSRIYFDILYNMIPDKEKKEKGMDEDSFVRTNRARVNKNSRASNAYANDSALVKPDNAEKTSEEISEYVSNMIRSMGHMSISDMCLCENWIDALHAEINTLEDGLYKAHIPVSATNEYISESYDVISNMESQIIMEADANNQIVVNSVLGCLLGTSSVTTVASVTAAPLTLLLFIDACGLKTATCTDITNIVSKKSRGKNIKAEILRDVLSIVRALSKETDEIDDYSIRDMKKRANQLKETLSFALKRKDTFSDTEKEYLIDLHHAATKMSGISVSDVSKNDKMIRAFFKASDNVIKMITKISDEDIAACANVTNEPEPVDEPVPDEEASEEDEVPEEDEDVQESYVPYTQKRHQTISEFIDSQNGYVIQEVDKGAIPAYMKTRIDVSDETGTAPKTTVEEVDAPSDDGNVPSNSIDDLADSIEQKVAGGGDDLKEMIGSEAKKKEGNNIVVNVTNNYSYSNSFNKSSSSNDLSTGKTIKNDNSINDNSVKDNSVKDQSVKDQSSKPSNNKYNSTQGSNTKDEKKVQEFSTGYSLDEVFDFLESEEPLLEADGAKPPKEDSLTKAMDNDRKKLPKKQARKKTVEKAVSTAKAVAKPVVRTKQWLIGIVDSLVQRREDKVKADIIARPSYRTGLYKAMRIAIKAGLMGVAFTISGYLAAAYVALLATDAYDKQRLRKEVESEFATEIEIINDKIALAAKDDTPESRRAKWQMMRLRSKMEQIATKDATKARITHPSSVQ